MPFLHSVVAIFNSGFIVLVKVTERYLKKSKPFWTTGDTMYDMTRNKNLVTFASIGILFSYAKDPGALEHAPKFITMLMRLQAKRRSGMYGMYLYCCHFIECKALEVSPRALFFFIIRETFHAIKIPYFLCQYLRHFLRQYLRHDWLPPHARTGAPCSRA